MDLLLLYQKQKLLPAKVNDRLYRWEITSVMLASKIISINNSD